MSTNKNKLLTFLVLTTMLIATGATFTPAHAANLLGCTSGAHTLSNFGDRVSPEMGNGGYKSVHSDIYIVYDAATNMF